MIALIAPLSHGFSESILHTSIDGNVNGDATEGGLGLEHTRLVCVVQPEVSDASITLHVAQQLKGKLRSITNIHLCMYTHKRNDLLLSNNLLPRT